MITIQIRLSQNSNSEMEKENDIEVVKYKSKNENFEIHSIKLGQNIQNKSKDNIETENVLNIVNTKNDLEKNENND